MADDKDYEQSALGKRVNELMDDGYDFGEAVKQAMSEGLKDGGAIGIEVLFSPKRKDLQGGGPAGGASAGGNYGGNRNPDQTYGGSIFSGDGGGNNKPPVVINTKPPVVPKDDKVEQNLITGKWMTNADLATKQKFLNYLNQNKSFNLGQDVDADTLYANYLAATGLDKHNKNVLVDSETINKSKEVDGKTIFDSRTTNDTFKDLDKDWTTRSTTVEDTAGNTTTNRLTPTGMWENDVYLGNRGPQNMAIDPPKSFDLPGNDLRADLTPKQKELLDQRKGMRDSLGDDFLLDTIKHEDDPDNPATLKDVTTYLGADGGRVGLQTGGKPYDPRASVEDYAQALQSVSGGTTYQQQADAKRYARQQANQMLTDAMKSADSNKGPGLQGIYETFFKNKLTGVGSNVFSPGASGNMISFSANARDKMLDAMANQMLDTTNYSQDNYLKKRQKEFGDYMDKLVLSNYGKADDYKAEAATLGMQTPQYFDYLTTSDPKNVLTSYATLSRDPLFDPKTYVARDPNEAQKLSPLNIYYQQELQNQIDAGIPESERIQMGQVMGMPGMVSAGGTMPSPYESYNDALARTKKLMGLRDGGRVNFNQGGWADGLTGEAKGIYDSMTAYGASDEEIQSRLQAQNLWSPDGSGGGGGGTEQVTGIINQEIGGDNFSPFNPDLNKVRTDYTPNYDYRKSLDYNPELSDLQNQKIMQNTLNYKGYDYYNKPAPTGLAKAINTGINFIPGIGTVKRGLEFVGNKLSPFMPINERAIFENELRGTGVLTDDIGRIVAGPGGYNTAEGIMAGYNANQMTDKTFDKRTNTIANTLSNKYGIDITELSEEDIENFDPKNKAYDLVNRYSLINQAKTNWQNTKKKADDIAAFNAAEKARKAKEKAAAASRAESARQYDPNVHGPNNYGLGSDGKQSYDSGQGFGINATTGGPVSNKTGRGRTDYSKGGLATMFTRRR